MTDKSVNYSFNYSKVSIGGGSVVGGGSVSVVEDVIVGLEVGEGVTVAVGVLVGIGVSVLVGVTEGVREGVKVGNLVVIIWAGVLVTNVVGVDVAVRMNELVADG